MVVDTFLATPADLHAAPGAPRQGWTPIAVLRPDAQRPLERAGRAQAQALTDLLPLFGARRLHAADRRRCIQTLEPLARRLGSLRYHDRDRAHRRGVRA